MQGDAIWSANSFVTPRMTPHERPGPPGGRTGEAGNSQGRYSSYAELLGEAGPPLDVLGAVDVLRDPYPREQSGYVYPTERLRTICRPLTAFSLVMQPAAGRMWVGELAVPSPLGRFVGFDLARGAALAEPAIPASGFRDALAGYRLAALGWHEQPAAALERALAADGPSAPLHLLLARVYAALNQPERAAEQRALALAAGARPGRPLPFPSAIEPLMYL